MNGQHRASEPFPAKGGVNVPAGRSGDSGVVAATTGDPFAGAACRTDPEAWTDPGRGRGREVVEACGHCPLLQRCREYTLDLIRRGCVPTAVVQAGVSWPVTMATRERAERILGDIG